MVINHWFLCQGYLYQQILAVMLQIISKWWKTSYFWHPFIINKIQTTKIPPPLQTKKKRSTNKCEFGKRQHCTIQKKLILYLFNFFLHHFALLLDILYLLQFDLLVQSQNPCLYSPHCYSVLLVWPPVGNLRFVRKFKSINNWVNVSNIESFIRTKSTTHKLCHIQVFVILKYCWIHRIFFEPLNQKGILLLITHCDSIFYKKKFKTVTLLLIF